VLRLQVVAHKYKVPSTLSSINRTDKSILDYIGNAHAICHCHRVPVHKWDYYCDMDLWCTSPSQYGSVCLSVCLSVCVSVCVCVCLCVVDVWPFDWCGINGSWHLDVDKLIVRVAIYLRLYLRWWRTQCKRPADSICWELTDNDCKHSSFVMYVNMWKQLRKVVWTHGISASPWGVWTPHVIQCWWAPGVFISKQDLGPFNHFCTAKPRRHVTDRQASRSLMTIVCISRLKHGTTRRRCSALSFNIWIRWRWTGRYISCYSGSMSTTIIVHLALSQRCQVHCRTPQCPDTADNTRSKYDLTEA